MDGWSCGWRSAIMGLLGVTSSGHGKSFRRRRDLNVYISSTGIYSVCTVALRPDNEEKDRLAIPKFTSQAAEAEWLDKNRKKLEADMSRRLARRDTTALARALSQSAATEKAKLKPVTIRMLPDDLETLRRVAAEK